MAKKDDFIELDKYVKTEDGTKKKWKTKLGAIYWLLNSKGELQNEPKIINENTNFDDFGIFLNHEQVLIPVKYFE